jgi:hypothetical protein
MRDLPKAGRGSYGTVRERYGILDRSDGSTRLRAALDG